MEKQNFNPHNPEYKKVADLPEDQRDYFVDEDGGFIYKSAVDYGYDQAYDNARSMRWIKAGRSINYEEAEKILEKSKEARKALEEKLLVIEKLKKEREPSLKKKVLFIEDDGDNIKSIESIISEFPGGEYIVAKSLDEAKKHLEDSDYIITDRFFPTTTDTEPSDNGLNILNTYPDKTTLITSGDTSINVGDHKWKKSKCITIAYHQQDQEKIFKTNLQDEESIVKKRPVDWAIAHNFATGAYQLLEKLSNTNVFKDYYHDNLAGFFSKFACGSPEQVEDLAFQKILSMGNNAKQKFPLEEFAIRYAFSVAETDNQLVLLMRKLWPQTADGYCSKGFCGMTTSDDPDPAYEKIRDNFIEIVDKLFEGTGCEVEIDWRKTGRDVSYDLDLRPLFNELMNDSETANKVAKFREKIEALL